MGATRGVRAALTAVVACFFCSGATGLIYEVLWIRMLGLVFGHTVFAVTTVLAAFMAGLGLGSLVFGRIADRRRHPLALYGLLEIGIGLFCLSIPLLLPIVERVYLALARGLHLSFLTFGVAQFALVFVLFLPPTTLMGATLPVLSRVFVAEERTLGRRVGLLYALNTFGAVAGTAAGGYLLLPAFGVRRTLLVAAALNVTIGLVVIALDRRLRRAGEATEGAAAPAAAGAEAPPPAARPGLVVATALGLALSGAASMVYEVAWTRGLSLVIGSSTYAFTAMLLAFLLGIALGSAVFSRFFGARRASAAAFGFVQLGIGAAALLILPAFERLPDLMLRALAVSLAPGFVLTMQVLLAVAAMLVPTLLIGATFPCAVAVVARAARTVGVDVGRLYAVNTLGAIVGAVLAGFVLIPAVGAHSSVRLAVVVNVVLGAGLVLASAPVLRAWQWATGAALAVVIVAGVVVVPAWNPLVMASGAAVYARQYQRFAGRVALAQAFPASSLLYYRDGVSATVSVHREGETVFLRVNGKTDASTGLDMHTQLMVGHLPLLAHDAPRKVLVVGLASGVTVGAVLQHPVERVDVVEIEPAMVEASRFFTRENRDPLRDPRTRLILGDARNFLLNTTERYDVIISEPSNPWIGGIASLFSAEFYALVRDRLAPGGVALQWVDGYTMHPEDLRMVARTFRTAFPATSVWNAQAMADFILIGRATPRPFDLARVAAAWETLPGVRGDLTRLGFRSPPALLADFLLTEADTARYAQDARINDDDLLPLEFSAPRSMYRDTGALNFRAVTAFRTAGAPAMSAADLARVDEPRGRHDLGAMYVRKNMPAEATAQFERALARDPADALSRLELGRLQLRAGLAVRAIESFESVRSRDPRNAEAHHQLALAYEAQRLPARALELAERAAGLSPGEPRYQLHLATLLQGQGRPADAVEHYVAARRDRPRDISVLDGLATAYLAVGRGAEAVTVLEEAIGYQVENPLLQERLGRAYLAVGRDADAVAAFSRAVAFDPLLVQAHSDLAYALMLRGDLSAAAAAVDRALALDPGQAPTARLAAEIASRRRAR